MDKSHPRYDAASLPDTNLSAGQPLPSATAEPRHNDNDKGDIDCPVKIIISNNASQDSGKAVPGTREVEKKEHLVEELALPTPNSDTLRSTSIASIWSSKVFRSTPLGQYMLDRAGDQPPPALANTETTRQIPPWKTTFVRSGPLSGILAMFLAIGCVVCCLGILAGSDQQTEGWSVPPSTWIAIFTAFANLFVRYAAIQGVVIAWWIKASKGSTLSRLHYDWRAGTTLHGAILSGRKMGLLGLACICSVLVVTDGPLLQRSTSVVSAPLQNIMPLNVSMVEEIPHDFTGSWFHALNMSKVYFGALDEFNRTIPSSDPSKLVPNGPITTNTAWLGFAVSDPWYHNKPLKGVVRGCKGKCAAKIRAPALAVTSCHTYVLPVDYRAVPPFTVSYDNVWRAAPMDSFAYLTGPSMVVDEDEEWINLVTGYGTTKDCKGVFNYTACTLKSAIGEYDVQLDGDELNLLNQGPPTIIALANNTAPNFTWVDNLGGEDSPGGYPSTLAGIGGFAYNMWNAGVFIQTLDNGGVWPLIFGGLSVLTMQTTPDTACPSFRDPRAGIIEGLNSLMFYIGALAALDFDHDDLMGRIDDGLTINKMVDGHSEGNHNVYQSNYLYWMGAAIIEVVCICLIAPSYWGWWKLGRHVSLSPLEMAHAFDAPLLRDCHSNLSGRELANEVGDIKVRYGVIADRSNSMASTRLAFADPAEIGRPHKDELFDA